ncbi:unnamed protein product, partial [Brassica rapa subsp. narinosa]
MCCWLWFCWLSPRRRTMDALWWKIVCLIGRIGGRGEDGVESKCSGV